MSVLPVGSLVTVAVVKAAVDGVVAPIVVPLIVVAVTGTVDPVGPTIPICVLPIITSILLPASKTIFVPALNRYDLLIFR